MVKKKAVNTPPAARRVPLLHRWAQPSATAAQLTAVRPRSAQAAQHVNAWQVSAMPSAQLVFMAVKSAKSSISFEQVAVRQVSLFSPKQSAQALLSSSQRAWACACGAVVITCCSQRQEHRRKKRKDTIMPTSRVPSTSTTTQRIEKRSAWTSCSVFRLPFLCHKSDSSAAFGSGVTKPSPCKKKPSRDILASHSVLARRTRCQCQPEQEPTTKTTAYKLRHRNVLVCQDALPW
jgi:hypothetical protein